jgi:hypothetical protein
MRLGETERDYYRLGSAGVTVPRDQEDAAATPAPAWTPDAQEDAAATPAPAWTPDAQEGSDPDGADQ